MIRANLGDETTAYTPQTVPQVCTDAGCMPFEEYKANLDRNVKITYGILATLIVAAIASAFIVIQYESKTRV